MSTLVRSCVSRTAALGVVAAGLLLSSGRLDGQQQFHFRSGVELINVNATVTDSAGKFIPGLTQRDFVVYDDDQPVEITHFNSERVPVSLGFVLDTSGSMRGRKIIAARAAIRRFVVDLLTAEDEVFFYRFNEKPHLVAAWTTDRDRIVTELGRLEPDGGTALYDAVAEALPLLRAGRHRKKALVVISDGIDTGSKTDLGTLRTLIRESEAVVYAIGIDAGSVSPFGGDALFSRDTRYQRRRPFPIPFPMPGRRTPPRIPRLPGVPTDGRALPPPPPPARMPPASQPDPSGGGIVEDAVNIGALRDITEDSGGRAEIVHDAGDLGGATSRIADELSKQYYLGYTSPHARDGQWHSIRVEVRGQQVYVRARRGYIAGP
jgi:VWFA-related protein